MTPQLTYDNKGNPIGVFLPIDDWNELVKHFPPADLNSESFFIPEWQVELGRKELKDFENGTTEFIEWNQAKSFFKS